MTKEQWAAGTKKLFEQTSLRNRVKYIDQWGLPKVIQQARDKEEQAGREHDWNIRNGKLYCCPTCGDRILKPGHCYNPHCPDHHCKNKR